MHVAKMSKGKGGKWSVTISAPLTVIDTDGGERVFTAGTVECKDAEQAADMVNAYNEGAEAQALAEKAAADAAASMPLVCSVNPAGELVVRFGDRAVNGFPVIQADRLQLEVLIAHWPIVVKAFEQSKDKLAATWKAASEVRKSVKATKAKA